ncbi:phage portal protein [Negativibacillus massiliensis]|uniref:phage portal protein n=1 Tax=Negativibacillus massiliensis TaxID=1871035 RepID=UPI0023F7F367|nr:phage portal protein [Negativibacillus massiliensis]
MSKRKKNRQSPRAEPTQKRSSGAWICTVDNWDAIICKGYTSLANNPEICTAVDTIARLIGSMTIHLMKNEEGGDKRVKNELSRKIDIDPNRNMTRSDFIQWIVKTMFLEGNGNAIIYPEYDITGRFLENLQPIPPYMVNLVPDGWGYYIQINGKRYQPDQVLHFKLNPSSDYPWKGEGYRVALSDVAGNLKQAAETEKDFMQSKWKPSIIVKVDALTEEFSSLEGRKKLLEQYVETTQAGEPWMIPADQFQVEQVKPLTLADLALADFVQLDKKTVAAILGVPPFVLGVDEFNRDAWNNFINNKIMPIARGIEQTMTRGLLISPEYYFRFNSWSLFSYSITELVQAGAEMVDRMALRRNEWRGWLNLPPDSEMEELLALENYIPAEKLGDQKKLK